MLADTVSAAARQPLSQSQDCTWCCQGIFSSPRPPFATVVSFTLHVVAQLPCVPFKAVRQLVSLHSPPPFTYSHFALYRHASADATLHLALTIKPLTRSLVVSGLTLGVIRCTSAKKRCTAIHCTCPSSYGDRGTQSPLAKQNHQRQGDNLLPQDSPKRAETH